jgi:hypothetical protein
MTFTEKYIQFAGLARLPVDIQDRVYPFQHRFWIEGFYNLSDLETVLIRAFIVKTRKQTVLRIFVQLQQ